MTEGEGGRVRYFLNSSPGPPSRGSEFPSLDCTMQPAARLHNNSQYRLAAQRGAAQTRPGNPRRGSQRLLSCRTGLQTFNQQSCRTRSLGQGSILIIRNKVSSLMLVSFSCSTLYRSRVENADKTSIPPPAGRAEPPLLRGIRAETGPHTGPAGGHTRHQGQS